LQWQVLQNDIKKSDRLFDSLSEAMTIGAYSGELTARWREMHSEDIVAAGLGRDTLVREGGTKIALSADSVATAAEQANLTTRHWLLGELSEFQRQVLAVFLGYQDQPLLAEDADVFGRFCDDEKVVAQLSEFRPSNNQIRRTLSQLSALGLIAKVTVPKMNLLAGEREYLKAFRSIREEERTRIADVEMMSRSMSVTASRPTLYFTVEVDRETAERAGAGGTFQVVSLTDADDKDRTDLIDSGQHYASFEELAGDIARRLDVHVDQIALDE
jgi:type I restriction enzyme, S subunit